MAKPKPVRVQISSNPTYGFSHLLSPKLNNTDRADPQTIGSEIEKQREAHGGDLSRRQLHYSAKPTNSPIHQYFEWNDRIAAEIHRDEQAAELMRSVTVIYTGVDGQQRSVRAFSSIRDPKRPSRHVYVRTSDALDQPETRDYILQQILNELHQWRNRWGDITEFAEALNLIDKALATMQKTVTPAVLIADRL